MSDDLAKALAPGGDPAAPVPSPEPAGAFADTAPQGRGTDGTVDDGAPAAGTAADVPEWAAGLPDDLRAWVVKAGHKDVAAIVKGYRELERKLGELGSGAAVRVPRDDAPAEEWQAFWRRLGAPEKPDEYGLDKLAAEVLGEGADAAFLSAVQQAMAEAGVPKRQAEVLARRYLELERAALEEAEREQQRETEELRTELGERFDAELTRALDGARRAGLEAEQVAALRAVLGVRGAFTLLRRLADALGEDRLPAGATGAPPMSKEAAAQRIEQLKKDPQWARRFAEGDPEALGEYRKLVEIAYG